MQKDTPPVSSDRTSQEPPEFDNWRHVSDRRMKKRIQNRVAQRVYRNKLKQRLQSLQQQVDGLEKQANASPGEDYHEVGKSMRLSTGNSTQRKGTQRHQAAITSSEMFNSGQHEESRQLTLLGSEGGDKSQKIYPADNHFDLQPSSEWSLPNHFDYVWDADNLHHTSSSISTTASSQMSANLTTADGIDLQAPAEHSHLLHISSEQPRECDLDDPPLAMATLGFLGSIDIGGTAQSCSAREQRGQTEVHQTRAGSRQTLDAARLHKGCPIGNGSKSSDQPMQNPGANQSATIQDISYTTDVNGDGDVAPRSVDSTITETLPRCPGRAAESKHRLRYVLDCAKFVGYDSIDDFISDYHTIACEVKTRVPEQEPHGRKRDSHSHHGILTKSSMTMSMREIQHREDGVLKFAESILSAECRNFSQSSAIKEELEQLRNLEEQPDTLVTDGSANSCQTTLKPISTAIRNALEDELPNLWALIMALSTENLALRQRDRSRVALVTIAILCCSGRVTMPQLGSWVFQYLKA